MDLLIYENTKLSMNYIFVDKHFFIFFLDSSFSDFFFAQQNLWKFSALKKNVTEKYWFIVFVQSHFDIRCYNILNCQIQVEYPFH